MHFEILLQEIGLGEAGRRIEIAVARNGNV